MKSISLELIHAPSGGLNPDRGIARNGAYTITVDPVGITS